MFRPRHAIRRASAHALTASLAAVAGLCLVVPAAGASTTPGVVPITTIAPLPFLHVVTPTTDSDRTPYLADSSGRQVLLRGVAAVGLQDVAYPNAKGKPALFPVSPSAYDGRCPAATPLIPQPPLCEVQASLPAYKQSIAGTSDNDFAQMRSLGYNLVRLVLNWSQLEPTPGTYSTTYLNRITQVVAWARQQGIYVILDMHQDQYSRYILPGAKKTLPSGCPSSGGSDGAPAWAAFTDGKPACADFGVDELNPAVAAAFYNFWQNHAVAAPQGQSPGTGLQDHYIGALAALAKRFENNSAVLGYEIMNEPQVGTISSVPIENLYQSSSQDLYPFYKKAVEALTGVRDGEATCPKNAPNSASCAYPQLASVSRQQIFFEPLAWRNVVDFSPQVSAPFSSYPNLVYAPHVYTHAFTLDTFLGYPAATSPFPPNYTFGYQTAEAEAQAMHAAVLTTEFGDSSSTDPLVLSGEEAAQESTLIGGTLWAWKGLSAKTGTCWCVRWQHTTYQTTSDGTPGKGNPKAPVSDNAALIASRQVYTSRVWPRATAGALLAYQYDPKSESFYMSATDAEAVPIGTRSGETEVYVPSSVHGTISVGGNARLDIVQRAPDGSRLAFVAPSGGGGGGGAYTVSVGAPSSALQAVVEGAAANPLQPISEPAARQVVEAAIAAAPNSTYASVRSNAAEVSLLGSLLLGSSDPNG
jgi:endoglycosylceramidase